MNLCICSPNRQFCLLYPAKEQQCSFFQISLTVLWIIKQFFLKLLRWNRFSSCPENNLRFVRGEQHIVARVVILWWSLDSTSWSFSRCLQMLQKSRTAQHFSQFFSCSFSSRKRFQIKRLLEQKETFKEVNAPNNNYSDK